MITQRLFELAQELGRAVDVKNVAAGSWVPLRGPDGRELEGIRGRIGAAGMRLGGEELGADLIEMASGTAFPPHTHPGDHVLFILSGKGWLTLPGERVALLPGDTVFIPGETPHGINCLLVGEPLTFLAVGVPHKHVGAADRMKAAEDA